MFIVEGNGQREVFNNGMTDDFLRFMPAHFGCAAEDITVWFCDESELATVRSQNRGVRLYFQIEDGTPPSILIQKKSLLGNSMDTLLTIPGVEIAAWPYNESGEFAGITLQGAAE